MRIAVAGGFGLGYLIATGLSRAATAHNIVVLSRTPRREFTAVGIQVHVVDYHNKDLLQFALSGVDLVISTISGQEQLNLINAACHGRVSFFIPSEFEGPLNKRPPARQDPLDRGSSAALTLLRQWTDTKPRFKWTVFSCGIFMERFHPYGLAASLGVGNGEGVGAVGSYVANINACIADYVPQDANGNSVKVSMTSVYDLVRFIIAAIDLNPSNWPTEFTMKGDRMSLNELVSTLSRSRNMQFQSVTLSYEELITHITYNTEMGQYARVSYLHRILETANGRYDFTRETLNDAISTNRHIRFTPMTFAQWLATVLA